MSVIALGALYVNDMPIGLPMISVQDDILKF